MGAITPSAGQDAAEAPVVSVEAKKWVRRHPARTASQQSVLEALAWASEGRGNGARMSYRSIAAETKLHRNTVLRALGQLEVDDRIIRHRGHGDDCARCVGARRGVAVYDVVIPAEPDQVPDGQMSLLAGAPSTGTTDWHTKVPVDVPVAEDDWHHHGATTGTTTVPLGSKGTYQHHHQEDTRELLVQVTELLERVSKPGWYVDPIAVEALVMTWSSHKDPLRAAASVVASAMDHQHLNAAKLLGRALEWQRLDQPAPRPGRRDGTSLPSPAGLADEFAQYDDAMVDFGVEAAA